MSAFSPKRRLFALIAFGLGVLAPQAYAQDYHAAMQACRKEAAQELNTSVEALKFEVVKFSSIGVRQKLWLSLQAGEADVQKAQCVYNSREESAALTLK
jgi:hypothetical protein